MQVGEEVLGTAAKVEVGKESTTIVGDGSSEDAVKARVSQIRNMVEQTEQDYEKEKLNERIARLAGGVAIIQVSVALCSKDMLNIGSLGYGVPSKLPIRGLPPTFHQSPPDRHVLLCWLHLHKRAQSMRTILCTGLCSMP